MRLKVIFLRKETGSKALRGVDCALGRRKYFGVGGSNSGVSSWSALSLSVKLMRLGVICSMNAEGLFFFVF